MADLDPIVAALRQRREDRNWSVRYVAELMGRKDKAQVSKWEVGKFKPNLTSLRCWAHVLGYDLTLTEVKR
jgi:transcriptional regulator with XRE-family HTH domain